MKRAIHAVVYILLLYTVAWCQPDAPALFRMQRVQPGESVCALVNQDGSYRLERLLQTRTELYTGKMDSERMDRLRTLLANQQLSRLAQSDIRNPLLTDTGDEIQIATRRDSGWQELYFFSPAGRKPFKESVDPLLRWFQELQKQRSSAVRAQGSPTHCMPATEVQLATVSNAEAPSLSPVEKESNYLFRLSSSHYYRARIDITCTVVFVNGQFHHERGGQTYMADRRDKIAQGRVTPDALQQLRNLLNAQDLKNSPGNPGPPGQIVTEDVWTAVSIPRDQKVQYLLFGSTFNTIGNPLEIGGKNNLTYHMADRKLLEPLKQWMKQNIEKQAHGTEADGAGNDCATDKTTAASEKPAN